MLLFTDLLLYAAYVFVEHILGKLDVMVKLLIVMNVRVSWREREDELNRVLSFLCYRG